MADRDGGSVMVVVWSTLGGWRPPWGGAGPWASWRQDGLLVLGAEAGSRAGQGSPPSNVTSLFSF